MADYQAVWTFLRGLVRSRRRIFLLLVVVNALAAGAAMLVPRLLGGLIDRSVPGAGGATEPGGTADGLWVLVGVVVAQAVFTFCGQRTSAIFGQDLLSAAREYIVRTILGLPLGRVEGASTGDLVTRVTRDVGTMSRSVQYAVPMAIISLLTVSLSIVAMVLNSPFLAAPSLLVIGSSTFQIRRYLKRAQKCYIAEGATYSRINSTLTETVEGARTVEALRLGGRRIEQGEVDVAVSAQAERYGMTLRNLLFAVIDVAFNTPRVITVLAGAYGYARGWVTLGQITAAVLYVEALSGPLDRLVGEVDRLQVGAASTSRLLGIAAGAPGPRARRRPARRLGDRGGGPALRLPRGARRPARRRPPAAARRAAGHRRPQRLRQVHPRQAAVRHQPAADRERDGGRRRPGVAAAGGAPHRGRAGDPGAPRLRRVGARQHRPGPRGLRRRCRLGGPGGRRLGRLGRATAGRAWTRWSAPGSQPLTPAQAQQIALARLIIADPHTLVLDEATSLIDPTTARSVEGSMNALLAGRTVMAIAHRLHTAHDADRIAVVIDGRVAELGSHDELVAQGGRVRRPVAGLDVVSRPARIRSSSRRTVQRQSQEPP